LTYHPLGGCPMADDANDGVVDQFGRVFGYPGLYVADGSIVPTAIGRNPSFTIAALSERVAEQLLTELSSEEES
ncbi:MAG: GMC family oxidoreductase, partial [Terriglobales bacterium]